MLKKESKIRVLENFYALDYVFFGKPVNEVEMCCPLVKEEYLSVKGALMSVYVEMLRLVEHTPDVIEEKINGSMLKENARVSASTARTNSQKIVASEKARVLIKGMLKETLQKDPDVNVTELVEKTIRSKAFGLAVDNLLIARTIKESKAFDNLNEWEGRIVEDSYKILRDNLVEAAHMILYDETEAVVETEKETVKEESLLAIIGKYGKKTSEIYNACMAKAKQEKWFSKNRSLAVAMCKQKDYIGNAAGLKKNINMCSKSKDPSKCKKQVIDLAKQMEVMAAKEGQKVSKLKSKMQK